MPLHLQPDLLADAHVRLERLSEHHAPGLLRAGDAETFRYMPTRPESLDLAAMLQYIACMRALPATCPFAVLDAQRGEAIGVTSYLEIRPDHRGLEIGHTWIGPAARSGTTNPSMKRLLLTQAFETAIFPGGPAIRVQLKTDDRNERSKRAILKLGARFEGVLRDHVIMPDGFLRQSALFSITLADWPGVKARLEARLQRAAGD